MNPIVRFLKANRLDVNRENYLEVAFLGDPPDDIDAEVEAEMQRALAVEIN